MPLNSATVAWLSAGMAGSGGPAATLPPTTTVLKNVTYGYEGELLVGEWDLPAPAEPNTGLRSGRSLPLNARLVAFPRQSFVDAELVVTGVCYPDTSIRQIELRFQSEDKTYRRGTKGDSGGTDEDA